MKHEIIYTEEYALIVSDEKMKKGDFNVPSDFDRTSDISITSEEDLEVVNDRFNGYKKVIAHRPLTDAPILKDVPLLPEFTQEEYVAELSLKTYPFGNPERNAFITGYNKAKETYKYTEKDLAEAYERGMNNIDSDGCHIDQPADDFTEFIQSLQQPKRPKYFECEEEVKCTGNNNNGCFLESPGHDCGCAWIYPTIINSQGQTELVGEYSYE
jgi:hypothetical protein